MDIAAGAKHRAPVLLSAFAVLVVGAVLFLNTFQSVHRQRQAVLQHMGLTARVVVRAVESSLGRGAGRMHNPMRRSIQPDPEEFFRELQQSEAILFVAAFDAEQGRIIGAPEMDEEAMQAVLQPLRVALAQEPEAGREGTVSLGDQTGYVFARQAIPPVASLLQPDDAPPRRRPGRPPQVFLAVALDMTGHMAAFKQFRRNAMVQAVVFLAVALAVLALGAVFLRRRMAAQRSRYLERFQSRLLDSLPDGLMTVDAGFTVQSANPAALRILGAPPDELLDRPCAAIDISSVQTDRWTELEVNTRRLEVLVLSLPAQSSQEGPGRLVILRDRTEIRELEERLAEARKLASLGELAAGVAHEIRNPLSALRGFAQFFAKKLAGAEPEETYAKTMVREADRLNRVVTDMLHLARPRPPQLQHVPMADLVDGLGRLLQQECEEKNVQLLADIQLDIVQADPDQLEQALLNLALNSLQALESSRKEQTQAWVRISTYKDETGGAVIEVADNGPGMDKEQQAQAFEPFFTTKDKGTGLGLAMVHAIARGHGGWAAIDTAPGTGTRVRLVLPRTIPQGTEEEKQ